MTHLKMHTLMSKIIKIVESTRDEGQKEYAHDQDDVFANFNRVANLLEEDRKKVLMTYMLKHVDGIAAFVKGHKSQREDVRGRITDCIVYLMLLWGMIEEEDDILLGRKSDSSLRDVSEKVFNENIGISLEGGCSPANGIHIDDNLQEMCSKGDRIQKSETLGRVK